MKKLVDSSRHIVKQLVPAKVIQSRLHRRAFLDFADKTGLVYFGYVDQRHDEHRLVRGLTLSARHRDNHYCIGTFDSYDITLVERTDTIHFPGKPARAYDWVIMAFDLHTKADLPHIFLGLHSHSDTFYAHLFTKFSQLAKVPLGTFGDYDHAFLQKYAIYTEPAQAIAAEQLFDHATAKAIAEHFGTLTVELAENVLYVYAEHPRPSVGLLERMLKYGTWLAQVVDVQAARLYRQQ